MRSTICFLAQCLSRFRQTGAILPSSDRLARAQADEIPALQPGSVIVELGPGTGVLTRELRRRFPEHRIVAIEANPTFVRMLREHIDSVDIIEGCASRIGSHLESLGLSPTSVAVVVSGLPLLSMPPDLVAGIFSSVAGHLLPGQRFIQFTYSRRSWRRFGPPGFRLQGTTRIWFNVPPAVVMTFVRLTTDGPYQAGGDPMEDQHPGIAGVRP